MTLNIHAEQSSTDQTAAQDEAASPGDAREQLVDEVLDELTSWNPREFIVAFRKFSRADVSLVHLNVLTLIDMIGPLPMGQLAANLDVSIASTTGIVERMEKRGLVVRRHDVGDRRLVLVHVTPSGTDVFRDIDRHRREGLAKLLGQMGTAELAGLLAGHRALRAARAAVLPNHDAERTARHGSGSDPACQAEAAR